MAGALLDVRESATSTALKTLPAPLSSNEYILFSNFVEVLDPLCVLTDQAQMNGITAPDLIPNVLEAYLSKCNVLLPF